MNYLPIDYECIAAKKVKKNIRECARKEAEFYAQQQKPTVLEQILKELTEKNPIAQNLIDLAVPVQTRQPMDLNMAQNILGMSPILQDSSEREPTIFDIINMQDSEEEEITDQGLEDYLKEDTMTNYLASQEDQRTRVRRFGQELYNQSFIDGLLESKIIEGRENSRETREDRRERLRNMNN